jgi:chloramphenicol 3-O phosphotransferase
VKSKIILLNGIASSGKTTLSRALQAKLEEPYLHVSVDRFIEMLPEDYVTKKNIEGFRKNCPKVIRGMHYSCRELANAGNNLIIDHVFEEESYFKECISLIKEHNVYFVGVHCSLEELERREKLRGDREIGLARKQFNLVHKNKVYDIEVDTSILEINKITKTIIEFLKI